MARYKLPDGMEYRPFGLADVYTNDNITDERVEKLLKLRPAAAKVFIDAKETKDQKPDEDKRTKKELLARYAELTGKTPDEKANRAELLELVKAEEEAAAKLG